MVNDLPAVLLDLLDVDVVRFEGNLLLFLNFPSLHDLVDGFVVNLLFNARDLLLTVEVHFFFGYFQVRNVYGVGVQSLHGVFAALGPPFKLVVVYYICNDFLIKRWTSRKKPLALLVEVGLLATYFVGRLIQFKRH